ncbi:hypothetical protein [Pseudoscardovia suis]|uniref:hypothetical protein n=1 Tax=Pseudoscardovia suis TaxID=987063 RepID=UPI003F95385B
MEQSRKTLVQRRSCDAGSGFWQRFGNIFAAEQRIHRSADLIEVVVEKININVQMVTSLV